MKSCLLVLPLTLLATPSPACNESVEFPNAVEFNFCPIIDPISTNHLATEEDTVNKPAETAEQRRQRLVQEMQNDDTALKKYISENTPANSNKRHGYENSIRRFLRELKTRKLLNKRSVPFILESFGIDRDMGKVYLAEFLWDNEQKALAFDTYFDTTESKHLRSHKKELRQWSLAAKDNPFDNATLLSEQLINRGLYAAHFRLLTCYNSEDVSWGSTWAYRRVFALINIYGESQCRLWAHEKGKRERWLDNPRISANILYQAGDTDAAFQTLEDANFTTWMGYSWLCQHSHRYDKLLATMQKRDHDSLDEPFRIHGISAFAARHENRNNDLRHHVKKLAEQNPKDKRNVTRQIHYLLILGAKQEALQTAYRHNRAEDVFKILNTLWKPEKAHDYLQSYLEVYPEQSEELNKIALDVYTRLNHPLAATYNSEWQSKQNVRNEYTLNKVQQLKELMQQQKDIPHGLLASYFKEKHDPELDKTLASYFTNGKFQDLPSHIQILEEAGEYLFLAKTFEKLYQQEDKEKHLFLSGHYYDLAGLKEKGNKAMRDSVIKLVGSAYALERLVGIIRWKRPDSPLLTNARQLLRNNFHILSDSIYLQHDCLATQDYGIGGRLLTTRSLQDMESAGGIYSKFYWALHNSSHGFEMQGMAAIEDGNLDEANRFLELSKQHSDTHFHLAKKLYHAYLKAGREKDADRVFEARWKRLKQLYKINPNLEWTVSQLVRWSLCCRRPMNGEGVQYAVQLLKMRGNRYMENRLLAEHLILNKELEKAQKQIEPWVKLRVRDTELQDFAKTWALPDRDPLKLYGYYGEPDLP